MEKFKAEQNNPLNLGVISTFIPSRQLHVQNQLQKH